MTVAFAAKENVFPSGRGRSDARRSVPTVLAAMLVAAAYYLGARLGFAFTLSSSAPTSILWLPNATMFAVFLLAPPRRWWVYALAALPAHLAVQAQGGVSLVPTLLLFGTNIADGMLGAAAIRLLSRPQCPKLDGLRNMLLFLAFAITAPFVMSFLDAAIVVVTGRGNDYALIWRTRFRSNLLTNIIWVPAVFIVVSQAKSWVRNRRSGRIIEGAVLAAATVLAGGVVFGHAWKEPEAVAALLNVPFFLLLWAALRFETAGVSVCLVLFAFPVIWSATHGHGPLANYSPPTNVLALQTFLTVLSITSLLLAALLQERRKAADMLREREAQYRSIFESTSDGVLITDLDHGVVTANEAFYQLTGYNVGSLRATHPRRFFHLADLQPFDAYLTRTTTEDDTVTQATCVREDGGLSLFQIHGRRFSYGGQPHVLSVVRDVTEREHAFRELEQRVTDRTRALSTLLEISKTFASTLDLRSLLDVVLEQLLVILDYTGATILMRENDEADMVILAHQGPLPPELVSAIRLSPEDVSRCPTLTLGIPIVLDDLHGDSPAVKAHRLAMPAGVVKVFAYARSVLLVPLKSRDHVMGVLRIDSNRPNQYTTHDAELAWALASQAAIAIENARLYEQAREVAAFDERQRLARELHDSVTQTLCAVAMLGKLLPESWARDPQEGRISLDNLGEMTQGALAEMRALLLELRPETLYETDLGDLLLQLAEAMRSRMRAPIVIDVDGRDRLPPAVHITLYRVAQEALTNVSKHAAANKVRVALRRSETGASLSVRDDGVGFSPAEVPEGRLGTLIMRERAAEIGASLTIDSAPRQGTVVSVRWQRSPGAAQKTG